MSCSKTTTDLPLGICPGQKRRAEGVDWDLSSRQSDHKILQVLWEGAPWIWLSVCVLKRESTQQIERTDIIIDTCKKAVPRTDSTIYWFEWSRTPKGYRNLAPMRNAMCACMASYFYSVHRHTHHKQKVVFLLGAAQFWSKFLNVFSEETAKFTVRLQKETDHAFSELSANSIFFQGHPTTIFGKISVRKTIWDLAFSEHLL